MNIPDFLRKKINRHHLYHRVFSSPDGQQVLKDIAKMAYIGRSTFCPNDPGKSAFNEGTRYLALEIILLTQKEPTELITQLIDEENK